MSPSPSPSGDLASENVATTLFVFTVAFVISPTSLRWFMFLFNVSPRVQYYGVTNRLYHGRPYVVFVKHTGPQTGSTKIPDVSSQKRLEPRRHLR